MPEIKEKKYEPMYTGEPEFIVKCIDCGEDSTVVSNAPYKPETFKDITQIRVRPNYCKCLRDMIIEAKFGKKAPKNPHKKLETIKCTFE